MRVISGCARGTKLNSIESTDTRPTLDRVKESLFNIIQNRIGDSVVLDLFAGSGAIGIEFISRGAEKVYFCEHSHLAAEMIRKNLNKTNFTNKSEIMKKDFKKCLLDLSQKKEKFDTIYIDPPYKDDLAGIATELIISYDLLKKDGLIIIETDEKERELRKLEKLKVTVNDLRKYGRAYLIFLSRKE